MRRRRAGAMCAKPAFGSSSVSLRRNFLAHSCWFIFLVMCASTEVVSNQAAKTAATSILPEELDLWSRSRSLRGLGVLPRHGSHARVLLQKPLIQAEGDPKVSEAPAGRFPYMALLLDHENNPVCTGILVHPSWVLTAAHCLDRNANLNSGIPAGLNPIIKLGALNVNEADGEGGVQVTLGSGILHPQWNGRFSDGNDIALVELKKSFNAIPIALPAKDTTFSDGEAMVAMGWGETSNGSGGSQVLRWGTLFHQTNEECNEKWKEKGRLINGMMCALGDKQNVCRGDSGGPLIKAKSGDVKDGNPLEDTLVGVTSFGDDIPCDDNFDDRPSVFTRITQYVDWIQDTINRCEPLANCDRCDDINEFNEALIDAATNGQLEKVKQLLCLGADINYQSALFAWTPMIKASISGHLEVVQFLVDEGGDLNAVSNSRYTAVMYAASNGHVKIVEVLVNAGANVELKNDRSQRARNLICETSKSSCTRKDIRQMEKWL